MINMHNKADEISIIHSTCRWWKEPALRAEVEALAATALVQALHTKLERQKSDRFQKKENTDSART